jgi:metal-responsive CopG/Arc/MetJ family transcriptional regulator
MLKTIQMTIDSSMLEEVDDIVAQLDVTRSAFIRDALGAALKAYRLRELRRLDEEGYRLIPQDVEEVEEWAGVQDWGDEWNVGK